MNLRRCSATHSSSQIHLRFPLFLFLCRTFYQSLKSAVERYLSPESGSNTTIVLPAFSGLFASMEAAFSAAPEEMPTRIPSVLAKFFPSLNASSFSIFITSSYIFVFNISGTNPALPLSLHNPVVSTGSTTGLLKGLQSFAGREKIFRNFKNCLILRNKI